MASIRILLLYDPRDVDAVSPPVIRRRGDSVMDEETKLLVLKHCGYVSYCPRRCRYTELQYAL